MAFVSLSVLMFFFLTIGVRTFTRQIVVKHFGVTNALTKLILFDQNDLNNPEDQDYAPISKIINWGELYPFPGEETVESGTEFNGYLTNINDKIDSAKRKIEVYATDFLIGYRAMTRWERTYRDIIHWNFVPYSEYNGVITMSDGYLTDIVPSGEVFDQVSSTVSLASFCKERGSKFLFVQAPHKICKVTDTTLSGSTDYSNQNADAMLEGLLKEGIDILDLREAIHRENLSHHQLFYRTDHHWTVEAGLWASRHILQDLNLRFGFRTDPSLLNDERFRVEEYPSWFLGTQGKKVTLAHTAPDDFSLLYPDYPTSFHYILPSRELDVEGDFSVLYDLRRVEKLDYDGSPYLACAYGDQSLEQITNLMPGENRKILLIHDSFGDCVIPFLALGVRNLDAIDLRHFTGSLQSYISSTEPDVVIVMYHCGIAGSTVNYETHKDLFDFR